MNQKNGQIITEISKSEKNFNKYCRSEISIVDLKLIM